MNISQKSSRRSLGIRTGTALAAAALAMTACGAPSAADETTGNSDTFTGSNELRSLLPQEIQDSGKIRVGMSPTGTPFSMMPSGEFEGMLPELAEAAGKLLDVEMEIVSTAFPSQIPALQAGRIDMIWGASADSAEREKVLDFVSYLRSPMKPLLLKSSSLDLKVEEDLCGAKIGAVQGGDIQKYMESQKQVCEAAGQPMALSLYDSSSSAVAQLQAGKVDAMMGMGVIQQYIAETTNNGDTFKVAELGVLPTIYGMGFAKGDNELQEALMQTLKVTVEKGTYGEVLNKYGASDGALNADEIMINGVGTGKLK